MNLRAKLMAEWIRSKSTRVSTNFAPNCSLCLIMPQNPIWGPENLDSLTQTLTWLSIHAKKQEKQTPWPQPACYPSIFRLCTMPVLQENFVWIYYGITSTPVYNQTSLFSILGFQLTFHACPLELTKSEPGIYNVNPLPPKPGMFFPAHL